MKSILTTLTVTLFSASFALTGCAGKDADTGSAGTETTDQGSPGTTGTPGGDDTGTAGTPGPGPGSTDDTGTTGSPGPGPGTTDDTGTTGTPGGEPGPGGDDTGDTGGSAPGPGGEPGPGGDDTGDTGGSAPGPGGEPGGGEPGGGEPGPGGDDTGDTGGSAPGPGGGPGGAPGGSGDDTAYMGVAFYISGLVEGSGFSQTFEGERGVDGYAVSGGYVDLDTLYCSWYASNSSAGTPSDCSSCEYSFDVDFDTATEVVGDSCDPMDEGLGAYGYTGPEVFEIELSMGFVKSGSSTYSGFPYDYGYLAFYYGYPYYSWVTTSIYTAFSYDDYYVSGATRLSAINGYYGVIFTP